MKKIQSFTLITSHAKLPVPTIMHKLLPLHSFNDMSACFLLVSRAIIFLSSFMIIHFSHILQVINGSFTTLPIQMVVGFPSTNLPISLLLEIPSPNNIKTATFTLWKALSVVHNTKIYVRFLFSWLTPFSAFPNAFNWFRLLLSTSLSTYWMNSATESQWTIDGLSAVPKAKFWSHCFEIYCWSRYSASFYDKRRLTLNCLSSVFIWTTAQV